MSDSGVVSRVAVALSDLPIGVWTWVPFATDLELLEMLRASGARRWALTINVPNRIDVCNADFTTPPRTPK